LIATGKKLIPATAKKSNDDNEYEFYYNGRTDGEDTGQHLSFICEFDLARHRKAFKIVEL
jgi:hypothetical protein